MLGQTKNFVMQRKETIKRQLQQNSIFNFCKPINIAAGKKLTLLMDEETIVLDKVNKQTPTIVVLNIEFFNQANNIYKSNKQCYFRSSKQTKASCCCCQYCIVGSSKEWCSTKKTCCWTIQINKHQLLLRLLLYCWIKQINNRQLLLH